MKQITFIRNHEPITLDVDMDNLSGTAYNLAYNIDTTDNEDDLSVVHVDGILTWEESVRQQFTDPLKNRSYVFPSWVKTTDDLEKHLNDMRIGYGDDFVDKPVTINWTWDELGDNESPEEYFERHALQIIHNGGNIESVRPLHRRPGRPFGSGDGRIITKRVKLTPEENDTLNKRVEASGLTWSK